MSLMEFLKLCGSVAFCGIALFGFCAAINMAASVAWQAWARRRLDADIHPVRRLRR